jgi:NLR family CARD domain-containing protein 3
LENEFLEKSSCAKCWVCEGWVEHKFVYNLDDQDIYEYPVYIHLDFDDFVPILMEKDDKDISSLYSYRMVPPGKKVIYFFSNPVLKMIDHD